MTDRGMTDDGIDLFGFAHAVTVLQDETASDAARFDAAITVMMLGNNIDQVRDAAYPVAVHRHEKRKANQ